MIYLATPYTKHKDGREYAFLWAAGLLATLSTYKLNVYCPIAHWHTATVLDPLNRLRHLTPDEWFEKNLPMMELCDCMLFPLNENIEFSEGVRREREYFESLDRPIIEFDPVRDRVEAAFA